jgi:plastocyanin
MNIDRALSSYGRMVMMISGVFLALLSHASAQSEQRVEVKIKDYTFITNQVPLMPDAPTVIEIRNEDDVRHDFGSIVFQNTHTQVESDGVIAYGRGVAGVFLDPAKRASVRFTIERPGRYEFRCSIHPNMRGELLLLNIGAV